MFTRASAHRFLVGLIVSVTAAVVFAAVTWHAGPTFTENNVGDPNVFTDDTFTATGDGSGFGNQPAVATITLNGTASYDCVNKGNPDNIVPGRNPVPTQLKESQDLGNADHNGRGVLNLTVGPITAVNVSGKTAGCPNNNWTGVFNHFTTPLTATLSITQANKDLLSRTCTYGDDACFSAPF